MEDKNELKEEEEEEEENDEEENEDYFDDGENDEGNVNFSSNSLRNPATRRKTTATLYIS